MSDDLRAITGDLRRYLRQQEEAGVRRLHLDETRMAAAAASAPVREPGSTPEPIPAAPSGEASPAEALAALDRDQVSVCTKCPLHESRTQTVFGVGNPQADVVLVGEAPGRNEDLQGEPFVGAAGQLLNKILEAIGFSREDVYICNVLKCRPPGNRDPEPGEVEQCEPYLLEQLRILQPKVILALGRFAAHSLLQTKTPLGRLRGKVWDYHGIPLMVTYHPAALLRDAKWKRPTWEDVQKLRALYDERSVS